MKAICPLSVIPVRKEPGDRSELVSQMLFGETATVIDSNDKWLKIKTDHDQYEGWVDKKQLEPCSDHDIFEKKINTAPLLIVQNEHNGFVFLPAGAILRLNGESEIICGSRRYQCKPEDLTNATTPMEIALGAFIFLDTPYLWGGRTLMGMDCSGFTQLIYRMHGTAIPRDAYQQAETGELISFADEAQTGDLAFFDNAEGRITHVGIIIHQQSGEKTIIHASGKVRMDRLDHQGIFNAETGSYSHNLRTIRRIMI